MEYGGLTWFNASAPHWLLPPVPPRFIPTRMRPRLYGRRISVVLWNLFRRHAAGGDEWSGAGVLQIGRRHLAYAGRSYEGGKAQWRVFLLFFCLARGAE